MKKGYYNPMYNEEKELSFSGCIYEHQNPDFINHLYLKCRYVLLYIINGGCYFEARGIKFHLNSGDLFIVRPKESVTYYSDGTDLETCSFCFAGTEAEKVMKTAKISKDTLFIRNANPQFVKFVTDCIEYTENNTENCSEFMLLSYLFGGLSTIESLSSNKISKSKKHITSAISFMEYNYGNGINVSDVAEHLHIDRTVFYKEFKAETGKTPSRFLMEIRIKKAKQLIRDNMEFKNVASAVGLKNVYHFSSLFKQIEGISPKEYKQKL